MVHPDHDDDDEEEDGTGHDHDDDGCCGQVGLVGFDSSITGNFPWQTIVWVSVNICVSNGATFGSTTYLLK